MRKDFSISCTDIMPNLIRLIATIACIALVCEVHGFLRNAIPIEGMLHGSKSRARGPFSNNLVSFATTHANAVVSVKDVKVTDVNFLGFVYIYCNFIL